MNLYDYQEAFGAWDKTTEPVRRAIRDWFSLYYGGDITAQTDPSQRIAYTVVTKLVKNVFGEYRVSAQTPFVQQLLQALDACRVMAVQLALVGGECYLKPIPGAKGFSFTLIPRNHMLIFGRNIHDEPIDVGTAEHSTLGNYYYTLLERRTVDEKGFLTIENKLYRSRMPDMLGERVPLREHPAYTSLAEHYTYEIPVGSVGLARLKTPMLNCVDGSRESVSVYAAAAGLIRNIDRNEAQLNGEFERGQSRIIASRDLLDEQMLLSDNLFVGLDDDPEHVGLTVFAPELREQSYLARKQEYLRNVETIIGLKRGMLSDSNLQERTATEIAASQAEHNLTVIDFQNMWENALRDTLHLCYVLGCIYNIPDTAEETVRIDWGNGTLHDEDKMWEDYRNMVSQGLLKPEIALGWRFGMPTDTEEQLHTIRKRLMPT